MRLGDKEWRDLKPDAQGFDEIRIITVPRYKESSLSGDEWRISATVQFIRKGAVVHEEYANRVESACNFLGYYHCKAIESGKALYAGEGDFCDQEGCSNAATVTYKKKFDYCRDGHKSEPHTLKIRKFCDRHKRRGDCGMDDSDENYEIYSTESKQ